MSIDLHTHSTASDGTDSPARLIERAQAAGVRVLGLTDHDATGGWSRAVDALPSGMTLVRGAELSTEYRREDGQVVPMHLLAYLFDATEPDLRARMDAVCFQRIDRAERMVARMAADGMPVSWADVQADAAGGTVGRPHIARALVRAGVVPTVNAAFAGPVNWRSPYYVTKPDIPVLEAIELVRRAGGVTVFAHPLRRGRHVGDEGIARMAAAGLSGLEVDHPDHDAEARDQLRGVARELDLAVTGSSDYHGSNKETAIAAATTAPDQFERLVDPAIGRLVIG